MDSPLHRLSPAALQALGALLGERFSPPFASLALARQLPGADVRAVAAELDRLAALGMQPRHIAELLRAIAVERAAVEAAQDRVELVWTGPEVPGTQSRDTSVVVDQLFRSATRSVLVSTYAIFRGCEIFATLAERMVAIPDLDVRLFVNVHREALDTRPDDDVLRAFRETFVHAHWPPVRLPRVYYDPRSLALRSADRAVLHAKTVIVDDSRAFVTSANFTEAAQAHNLEAGVLVDDARFACALRQQFDVLVQSGALRPLI